MRLPNFLNDPGLNDLRDRMGGAELGIFRLIVNPYRFTIGELEDLILNGIDIRFLDEVRALPDGTLSYKERRVALFAREVRDSGRLGKSRGDLPHFHVANCRVVRAARAADGAVPYAVSAREDGNFRINLGYGSELRPSLERLPVCGECLSELAFDGYSSALAPLDRARVLQGFTLTRFFERYRRALAADVKP